MDEIEKYLIDKGFVRHKISFGPVVLQKNIADNKVRYFPNISQMGSELFNFSDLKFAQVIKLVEFLESLEQY